MLCKRRNPLRRPIKCRAHAVPRSSSDHVVAIERGVQRNGREEVLTEFRAKLAQLFDGQAIEFDALVDSETNSPADFLVAERKGTPL